MSFCYVSAREASLLDDAFMQYPDAGEQMLLEAIRTWFRPHCDAVRRGQSWRDLLSDVGLLQPGIDYFEMAVHALLRASCRPLDTRCRCATGTTADEASLLQAIAHLQSANCPAAVEAMSDWLPDSSVGNALKITRCFAVNLLDTGITIRARERRVTYMH
jgi:hypothetical protein